MLGNTIVTIRVRTNNLVDTTDAIKRAIILVINPPKYGITVVIQASTPKSKKLGWPIKKNKNVYSKNCQDLLSMTLFPYLCLLLSYMFFSFAFPKIL